jgi:SOS-response transcriptional repressor LexA
LESGAVESPRGETLAVLAKGLGVTISELMGEVNDTKDLIGEIREMLRTAEKSEKEAIPTETRVLPVLGHVPCSPPIEVDQEPEGEYEIPKSWLGEYQETQGLYILVASGDSLIGDGIADGTKMIVNPGDRDLVEGKIYIVLVENKSCAKKLIRRNGRVILVSSNPDCPDIIPDGQVQIQGRVIHSWREH